MSPASPFEDPRRGHAVVDEALEQLAERAGVELVAWPRDEARRRALARAGVPRLLLVDADADAPEGVGLDEDWLRLPFDGRDLRARMQRLARVIEQLQHDHPVLDPSHIVHFGGTSVVLSAAQASVTELLLDHPGRVVPRTDLESVLWPEGAPGPKALDGVVFRLRRRLAGLGLVVRSAHGRGFSIDAHDRHDAHDEHDAHEAHDANDAFDTHELHGPGTAPPADHPTAV